MSAFDAEGVDSDVFCVAVDVCSDDYVCVVGHGAVVCCDDVGCCEGVCAEVLALECDCFVLAGDVSWCVGVAFFDCLLCCCVSCVFVVREVL